MQAYVDTSYFDTCYRCLCPLVVLFLPWLVLILTLALLLPLHLLDFNRSGVGELNFANVSACFGGCCAFVEVWGLGPGLALKS